MNVSIHLSGGGCQPSHRKGPSAATTVRSAARTACPERGRTELADSLLEAIDGPEALRRLDNAVVAVIGDGALTGGLAYEALNNFGATGRRAVIVLNDNGRCYAPTVSRLTVAGHASGETGDPAAFFTALGLDYVGPVDGHDV